MRARTETTPHCMILMRPHSRVRVPRARRHRSGSLRFRNQARAVASTCAISSQLTAPFVWAMTSYLVRDVIWGHVLVSVRAGNARGWKGTGERGVTGSERGGRHRARLSIGNFSNFSSGEREPYSGQTSRAASSTAVDNCLEVRPWGANTIAQDPALPRRRPGGADVSMCTGARTVALRTHAQKGCGGRSRARWSGAGQERTYARGADGTPEREEGVGARRAGGHGTCWSFQK